MNYRFRLFDPSCKGRDSACYKPSLNGPNTPFYDSLSMEMFLDYEYKNENQKLEVYVVDEESEHNQNPVLVSTHRLRKDKTLGQVYDAIISKKSVKEILTEFF